VISSKRFTRKRLLSSTLCGNSDDWGMQTESLEFGNEN